MLKHSHFSKDNEAGHTAIPLFGKADSYFEKTAAPALMPEIVTYIEGLRPIPTSQYVLVNAMGSGEYYSSNINGDHFPEAGLIHKPDDWAYNPVLDSLKGKQWAYGFPTFYNAHPFAHHRNKDPGRAFGEVELSTWNPHMHRVELVTRVDSHKCQRFGGVAVWDKLKTGQFPDVSMGSKVPFDTCSICLDWKQYRAALATFDPKRHRHPGQAVLEVHKKRPIKGVSITRKDYCIHARTMMNRILPDGRKVFVYNDFPRFFDISFVFIGADRTAKTMLFIFSGGKQLQVRPSAGVTEMVMATRIPGEEKAASVEDYALQGLFSQSTEVKESAIKASEILKKHMPSNLASKALPVLSKNEKDIPRDVLDGLAELPLKSSLSTLGGMGVVLRPKEFQRLILTRMGSGGFADKLDAVGEVFPKVDDVDDSLGVCPANFVEALLPLLLPLLKARSGLGPIVEKRVLVLGTDSTGSKEASVSHHSDLMHKIGAAYNGYRSNIMELAAHSQNLLGASGVEGSEVSKLAGASLEDMFTPLAANYLQSAFLDEVGDSTVGVVKT